MIQEEQELRLSFLLTMLNSALVRNIQVCWSACFITGITLHVPGALLVYFGENRL